MQWTHNKNVISSDSDFVVKSFAAGLLWAEAVVQVVAGEQSGLAMRSRFGVRADMMDQIQARLTCQIVID